MMIDFFRVHFESVVSIFCIGFSLACSIVEVVKRSRIKKTLDIVAEIPEIISQVESILPNGFGSVKLGFVLRQVEKLCVSYGIKFDKDYFREIVEKVLAAPTKG